MLRNGFFRIENDRNVFCDSEDASEGEIPLSCKDDGEAKWDPYTGKQITYMKCASFADADVSRAYLDALTGGSLFSMEDTNFDRAKMNTSLCRGINFSNASFKRTQLFDSKIQNCNFMSADLTEAVLAHSRIEDCQFENANLSHVILAESALERNEFRRANLMNANFTNSRIPGCRFEEASCQNASFKNITQTDEQMKDCSGSLRFCYATLTKADFSGAILDYADFSHTIASGSIFTKVSGKGTVFTNAMLTDSIWNSANITSAEFINTVTRNVVIIGTEFINCNFVCTDFAGALFDCGNEPCFIGGRMCDVNFSGAVGLTAAAFRKMALCRVDFSGTGIKEIDFQDSVKLKDCRF